MNARLIFCALLLAMPAEATTRFFLGVGSSRGDAVESPLKWAVRDANRVRDVFVDLGGVHKDRAVVLEDPSKDAFERALVRLQGNVEEAVRQGERTEVIVHYAGHGDSDALHVAGVHFTLAEFKRRLSEIPSQAMIVVIDACRTRAVPRGAAIGPRFEGSVVRELAPNGTVLLFSARDGEVAQESDDLEGAFFTHALLGALRGAADTDGDRRVTLAEAWQRAHASTLARTHERARAQHPEIDLDLAGEGEIVLTELDRARASLVLDSSIVGSILVLEARTGRVIVEVDKFDSAPIELAVPPGRLGVQVRRADQNATYRGEIALDWGGKRVLSIADLTRSSTLLAATRGGGDVDLTPLHGLVAGGAFFSSHGLPGGVGLVSLEHRVFEWPFFLGATIDAGVGARETERWLFEHSVVTLALTTSAERYVGPVRLFGGLDGGAAVISQYGVRRDAERLRKVLGASPVIESAAIAPTVMMRAGAGLSFFGGLSAVAFLRGGGMFAPVLDDAGESNVRLVPRGEMFFGLGWEL